MRTRQIRYFKCLSAITEASISSHGLILDFVHTYSVRSAYNLAHELLLEERNQVGDGSSFNMLNDAKLWRKLWASKIYGKIKITIWWVAHNNLPCGVRF
jgi:hypothetical protein